MAAETVYLSLGSNLGARRANLIEAVERMEGEGVRVVRASPIYETAPRDFLDQPGFLNPVVEAETSLFPPQLLAALLAIETAMGRVRTMDKGPRVIDLDILAYGARSIDGRDCASRTRAWRSGGLCWSRWPSSLPVFARRASNKPWRKCCPAWRVRTSNRSPVRSG